MPVVMLNGHCTMNSSNRLSFSRRVAICLVVAIGICTWTGCGTTKAPRAPTHPPTAFDPSVIREGDVISIVFPGATNLNKTLLSIPPGGKIKLDFIEEIVATGRTPAQLQADILEAYGNQLQLKEVSVTVLQTSARVYVQGEVLRPGPVAMTRPLTALEAVMECGGLSPMALPARIGLVRKEGALQKAYQVDLRTALSGTDTNPVYLQPNDVLTIPRRKLNL
jgi:polysaccharide biosynthesis/export protein